MRKIGLSLFFLCVVGIVAAAGATCLAGPISGIVLSDSDSVKIIRTDGQQVPCKQHEALYEGDRLVGPGATSVQVKWYLYAKAQVIGSDEIKVEVARPSAIEQLSTKIQEFLGILDTERKATNMVTRSGDGEEWLLPGHRATLVPGYKVNYSWGKASGKAFLLTDNGGKELFRRSLSGQNAIELSPEELRLKPGEAYSWMIEGVKGKYQIVLLEPKSAELIKNGLSAYNSEKNAIEKAVKQAAYLQLMSDCYPDTLELYWLSAQVLKDAKASADPRAEYLEKRIARHFDE